VVNEPQRRSVTIGVRGWLTAAAIFVSAYTLWLVLAGALNAFVLLFTGILLAAALRPLVNRLSARMPFGAAAGVAFGSVLSISGLVTYILIAPIGAEVEKLVSAIPGYVASLQERLVAAQRLLKNDDMAHQVASTVANGAGGAVTAIGTHLLSGPAIVATIVGNLLIIILLAIGWMLASDELEAFALSLLRPSARSDWQAAFSAMGSRLSAYVQGIVLNGAIVGVAMGAALALLGIPYALLLGFIVALLQAIPMVGAVISGPIVLLVVLATSGWTKMWIVLGIFAVVQILDQNVLSPIIFGQRVQLSFLLIIFSTVMGGMLLGIAGAFLAVPAAAVLQVVVVQIIAPSVRRANELQDGAGATSDGAG
jgi:predicted PurR-regulated permease PerM